MNAKKLFLLALVPSLLLCSCNSGNDDQESEFHPGATYVKDISYKVRNAHDTKVTNSKELSFSFDINDLITKDPSQYNPAIAKTASLLAAEAYSWCDIEIYNPIKKDYTVSSLMEKIGFQDIKKYDLKNSGNIADAYDTGIAFIGKQIFYDSNDVPQQVVMVDFAGTEYDQEWSSNFDIGANTDAYTEITGTHKEWKNKKHHKGFDVALNRFIKNFDKYAEDNIDNDLSTTYLVTGHSRGGAIANLYGAYLTDKNIKNFTYTFAAPNVIESDEDLTKKYSSIFNIMNGNDLIANVPPSEVGFKHYGKDITHDVSDLSDFYKAVTEERTYASVDTEPLKALLVEKLVDRETMYVIPSEPLEDDHDKYDTKEAADEAINKALNTANKYKIKKYFSFSTPTLNTETNKYEYYWCVAPAVILKAVDALLTSDSNLLVLMSDFSSLCPTYVADILTKGASLIGGMDGLAEAHMPEAYMALVDYLNSEQK